MPKSEQRSVRIGIGQLRLDDQFCPVVVYNARIDLFLILGSQIVQGMRHSLDIYEAVHLFQQREGDQILEFRSITALYQPSIEKVDLVLGATSAPSEIDW